jgi:hypothetical protein
MKEVGGIGLWKREQLLHNLYEHCLHLLQTIPALRQICPISAHTILGRIDTSLHSSYSTILPVVHLLYRSVTKGYRLCCVYLRKSLGFSTLGHFRDNYQPLNGKWNLCSYYIYGLYIVHDTNVLYINVVWIWWENWRREAGVRTGWSLVELIE